MKEPALAWPPPWLRENRIGDFGMWASGRQSDRKGYACATNTLLQSDRTGQTVSRFVQAPGPTLQAGCCRQTVSRFVGPGANNAGRLLPSVQNWTIYRKDRSGAVTDRPGVELVFFFVPSETGQSVPTHRVPAFWPGRVLVLCSGV